MGKHTFSAQQAMNIVRSPESEGQERQIVGLITNQDEAVKFLEWLSNEASRLSLTRCPCGKGDGCTYPDCPLGDPRH